MLVLILLLNLAQAEYYGKYGAPDDLYNFYKNGDTDETPATTTDATVSEEDGFTQTMQRLAMVSADSLRTLDKKELMDFKEALTMLMQSTERGGMSPTKTEYDTATRTANTHALTPRTTAINNILLDILDKLETRTQALDKPTHTTASLIVSTRAAPERSSLTPTHRTPATINARRWIAVDAKLPTDKTTEQHDDVTNLTTVIDATDETDTVLAQTASPFEKTEPVTSEDMLNETVSVTDTATTDTDTPVYDTTTAFNTDKDEERNETLPQMYIDTFTGVSDSVEFSNTEAENANSSSVNWRAGGVATMQGLRTGSDPSFRRQHKITPARRGKYRVRKTRTKSKKRKTPKFTYSTTTTKSRRRKTKFRTTTKITTTMFPLDVPKLIELITNLTLDYGPNITRIVNDTLQDLPILTCPTVTVTTTEEPTTTTEPTTTPDPYGNLTGTIMGKCFVCGLETPAMPRHAQCADAFAGDFIPLVPVDATARKMLASYRKYCRWMNVPKYIINETDPRSMWGRWTGGCSVRWIDISGIYTQRTCRNRHRAVMGKHWVSKRMAKLEMALQRMDSGCIISPMASLVPLSRGMSLYARFHACVCTGSWCNRATPSTQCMLLTIAVSLMLLFMFRFIDNAFYNVSYIT